MARFDADVQSWVLASEGGYVDDPRDPGGATNMGITHKTLAAWRGVKSVTKAQVKALSREEALQIYKANYWDRIAGDQLPAGVAYAVFDYAVHSGVSRAVKDLQRTLKYLGADPGTIDGVVGVRTLQAINTLDGVSLIIAYCERRLDFVQSLSTYATFGRGWYRRIMGERAGAQTDDVGVIDRAAMQYLGAKTIPAPVPSGRPEDHGKAVPEVEGVGKTLQRPESLAMLGGALGSLFSAINGQPILQVGVIALLAFGVFVFVKRRRELDPS